MQELMSFRLPGCYASVRCRPSIEDPEQVKTLRAHEHAIAKALLMLSKQPSVRLSGRHRRRRGGMRSVRGGMQRAMKEGWLRTKRGSKTNDAYRHFFHTNARIYSMAHVIKTCGVDTR